MQKTVNSFHSQYYGLNGESSMSERAKTISNPARVAGKKSPLRHIIKKGIKKKGVFLKSRFEEDLF